ncbi:hypothetical protein OXA69_22545, partial [Klebsiella pneumoniae]
QSVILLILPMTVIGSTIVLPFPADFTRNTYVKASSVTQPFAVMQPCGGTPRSGKSDRKTGHYNYKTL